MESKKPKENKSPWMAITIIIILFVILSSIAAIFILHTDIVGGISLITGFTSIGVGIYAIIQSSIYNEASSQLNAEIMTHLGGIENAQDNINNAIDSTLKLINENADLSLEAKDALCDAMDDLSSRVALTPQSPIQKMSKIDVLNGVEELIKTYYAKNGVEVNLYPKARSADVVVQGCHKTLAFLISARSSIMVSEWPENVAFDYFSSKYNEYYGHLVQEEAKSNYCITIMIYANCVYYCICDSTRKTKMGRIDTKTINLLKNNNWLDTLNKEIEKYIAEKL